MCFVVSVAGLIPLSCFSRAASHAIFLAYTPMVRGEDFSLWQEYAQANKQWVEEAFRVNSQSPPVMIDEFQEIVGPFTPYVWNYTSFDAEGHSLVYDSAHCRTEHAAHNDDHGDDHGDQGDHYELDDHDNLDENNMVDGHDAEEWDPESGYVPTTVNRIPVAQGGGFVASPLWISSPPPHPSGRNMLNLDMQSDLIFKNAVSTIARHRTSTFNGICGTNRVRNIV
jgi:hypothetical protein